MSRQQIPESVKRKLWAESMGRCMNPCCRKEVIRFDGTGDILEQAHIVAYCETANNSFDNLVILCPNCHTDFDKNHVFTVDDIRSWKETRQNEIKKFFGRKYVSFREMSNDVVPLLEENKMIYENYYLGEMKELWDKAEHKVLINNRKLKVIFQNNLNLFHEYRDKERSNREYIYKFIAHVDEFELTRTDREKCRKILFPKEIDSMFGIEPTNDQGMVQSVESLEALITKLSARRELEAVVLDEEEPYIQICEDGNSSIVFLNDAPRLRQLYYDFHCLKTTKVRLDALIYIFRYMKQKNIRYKFLKYNNLREIAIRDIKIIFVYEYCLNQEMLRELMPDENSIIVNLHRWNGDECITKLAYHYAKSMSVTLMTEDKFKRYVNVFRENGNH